MLECRTYTYQELKEYLGAPNKQSIERKLARYEVEFSSSGRGETSMFQIEAIHNPFKVFAVFDLGASPQTDFRKFSYFIYQILNDNQFNGMGAEMMEEKLRNSPCSISRGTISHYLKNLQKNGLIAMGVGKEDYVYYKVYKKYGEQTHEVVSKEEYSKAWGIYWNSLNSGYDCRGAFSSMYNKFGGAPRKHPTITLNVFYQDIQNWLLEILSEDFGG